MPLTRNINLAILLLRIAVGTVFVMHGWQKLFVFGHDGLTGFLAAQGIPFPAVNAVIVTTLELGGGLALLVGLLTRLVSPLLAFTMFVAFATVHAQAGFFLPNGYEFVFTLLLATGALTLSGAGAYSIDARLWSTTGSGRDPVRASQHRVAA